MRQANWTTALIVDPFDVDQIVDALDRALAMPLEERRARYEAMMARLGRHDVHAWREAFLNALQQPKSFAPSAIDQARRLTLIDA